MADQPSAADLPDFSIVAGDYTVWIKSHPSRTAQWRGTDGGYFGDWYVDERITAGAQVLRVGGENVSAEVDRYQREARDVAADSGRRLKLLAQAHNALVEFGAKCLWHHNLAPVDGCGACESAAIVGAAVAALKEEAARSPWLAERISETQEVSRG